MLLAEAEGPGTADRAWPVRSEEDDQVDSLSGSALLMLEIGADFLLGITGGDFAFRSGADEISLGLFPGSGDPFRRGQISPF